MSIIKINPGDFFGSFKVIKKDTDRQAAATYWICQCVNCKTQKSIRATELRKGPSCRCKKSASLIGQEINGFKVLKITNKRDKSKSIILECECLKCHHIEEISSNVLRAGRKYCSKCHIKKTTLIDLTGEKYGFLEVLRRDTSLQHIGHEQDSYWVCKCHNCGTIKTIRGISLRKGLTISCGCINSKGETQIAQILTKHNIPFIKEYTFPDLYNSINHVPYRFDFAIFNSDKTLSHLVEFDGKQHFIATEQGWNTTKNLLKVQSRDNIKNKYCKNHNIKLIRIKYDEEITLKKIMGEKQNDTQQSSRTRIKNLY